MMVVRPALSRDPLLWQMQSGSWLATGAPGALSSSRRAFRRVGGTTCRESHRVGRPSDGLCQAAAPGRSSDRDQLWRL